MSQHVPESDWKRFRELRELALERFCERVFHGLLEPGELARFTPGTRTAVEALAKALAV